MKPLIFLAFLLFEFMNAAAKDGFHTAMRLGSENPDTSACLFCHTGAGNFGADHLEAAAGVALLTDGEEISQSCIGCHNGIEAKTMNIRGHNSVMLEGEGFLNSHPVFIGYNAIKPILKDENALLKGTWYKAERVKDLLRNQKVVCVSCHDPHNSSAKAFLRNPSALCNGCHLK